MSQSVSLRPLNVDSNDFQSAVQLYINSFPACERRDVNDWSECVSHKNNEPFFLYGIYVEDKFMGIISCWNFSDFIYAEHFAVDAQTRGHGIGARTMGLLKEHYETMPIILEVEPPCEEMSIRRVGFYERQGFHIIHKNYKQPPYRKEDEWFELKLMTTNTDFLEHHFERVKNTIYKNVYHVNI